MARTGAVLAEECVGGFVKLLLEVHEADVDEMLGEAPLYKPQGGAGEGKP